MRKFTYWVCRQERDAECYNIRARTKKEALKQRAEQWRPHEFSPPFKVTVCFEDIFDLVDQAMGEGTIYEYPQTPREQSRDKKWNKKRRGE